MAGLKDSNGKVVIDEQATETHVRNIRKSMRDLNNLKNELNPQLLDSSLMSGTMRDAVDDLLRDICKKIPNLLDAGEEVARGIERTLEKYRRIDREFARKTAGRRA